MYNNKNQADPEVEKKVKNAHTLKTAPHRESGRYVETVEKSLTQIRNTSPRQSSGAPHNYAQKKFRTPQAQTGNCPRYRARGASS